jgi:hypothetical protein
MSLIYHSCCFAFLKALGMAKQRAKHRTCQIDMYYDLLSAKKSRFSMRTVFAQASDLTGHDKQTSDQMEY